MRFKFFTILLFIFLVCAASGVSLGQPDSEMTAAGFGTVEKSDIKQSHSNVVPSIGDLITVVDKATETESNGTEWSTPVKLVIIFTGLAILPSLLAMMTSFTRIVIVLSFVRRALSTQSIPPTIAIMGLALFLTI